MRNTLLCKTLLKYLHADLVAFTSVNPFELLFPQSRFTLASARPDLNPRFTVVGREPERPRAFAHFAFVHLANGKCGRPQRVLA